MTVTELQKERRPAKYLKRLPLVLEILPGQAGEGLVVIFEPGSYEHLSLKELCDQALARKDLSIEEQVILEDINRQLAGGKLLVRGRELKGGALEFAAVEETETGEEYLYLPIRAIKPQEGGCRPRKSACGFR
jgi:hypothetical protein